jgi:predicted nucleic acid-binding protein
MKPLSSLPDLSGGIVIDASTAINLNATGCADRILRALPCSVLIEQTVIEELDLGRLRGREDADLTARLLSAGLITRVSLGAAGQSHFETLVVGLACDTLDDGEAATIAYALELGATPIIDERKAHRICGERFPYLPLASTVDLLAHSSIAVALGRETLMDAVLQALLRARMRVLPHRINWVVELIGASFARECPSLPRQNRRFAK